MQEPLGVARQLLADLDAATARRWTDERDGSTYDLTEPLRDANGDYWHHIGWLTLPGHPGPVPMVMWSMSANREHLGRRWADVAPLVSVIDENGPFGVDLDAALAAKAEDDRAEVDRTR